MKHRHDMPFAELFDAPLRNGLTKPKAVRGAGMKMVNMGEVFAHRRILNLDMDRVPMESKERESSLLRKGDLLFARQSLVLSGAGKCVLFQGDKEDVTFESHIIRCRLNQQKASPAFYFYLFQSSQGRSLIESIVEQVAAAGIRGSDLGRLIVPVPPLPEQRAIAHVLGSLDDLIELNRETNKLLEDLARALFKNWFVDFDPVRAKLEGRPPAGMDAETAKLFPDHFQDSELGQIPRGWEVGPILRQADLLSGGTPKTDVPSYWGGDVPWASAKDVSQCGEAFLVNTERTITRLGVEKSSTKIIPALATVIVARGATTGRLTMFGHDMAMNQTCYGIRSKFGAPFALYCHARDFSERLVQGGHGSIFDTITTSTFEATGVILPPKELLLAFDRFTGPMFAQILSNLSESRDLATLRDTLLPKLLRGGISAPVAEEIIAAST